MGLIQFARPAPIEALVDLWMSESPSFLWAPTNDRNMRRCRVTGAVATVVGNRPLSHGGLVKPVAASADRIEFPTSAGITAAGQAFYGMMVVSIEDASSLQGYFLNIGSVTTGIGFGAGSTTMDAAGTRIMVVLNNIAWQAAGNTDAFVNGTNVLFFGVSSDDGYSRFYNFGPDKRMAQTNGTYNAPSATIQINGITTARGTQVQVHAVTIFNRALTATNFDAEYARFAYMGRDLLRLPRQGVIEKFRRSTAHVPVASAGGGGFKAAWVRNRSQVIGAGVR